MIAPVFGFFISRFLQRVGINIFALLTFLGFLRKKVARGREGGRLSVEKLHRLYTWTNTPHFFRDCDLNWSLTWHNWLVTYLHSSPMTIVNFPQHSDTTPTCNALSSHPWYNRGKNHAGTRRTPLNQVALRCYSDNNPSWLFSPGNWDNSWVPYIKLCDKSLQQRANLHIKSQILKTCNFVNYMSDQKWYLEIEDIYFYFDILLWNPFFPHAYEVVCFQSWEPNMTNQKLRIMPGIW